MTERRTHDGGAEHGGERIRRARRHDTVAAAGHDERGPTSRRSIASPETRHRSTRRLVFAIPRASAIPHDRERQRHAVIDPDLERDKVARRLAGGSRPAKRMNLRSARNGSSRKNRPWMTPTGRAELPQTAVRIGDGAEKPRLLGHARRENPTGSPAARGRRSSWPRRSANARREAAHAVADNGHRRGGEISCRSKGGVEPKGDVLSRSKPCSARPGSPQSTTSGRSQSSEMAHKTALGQEIENVPAVDQRGDDQSAGLRTPGA